MKVVKLTDRVLELVKLDKHVLYLTLRRVEGDNANNPGWGIIKQKWSKRDIIQEIVEHEYGDEI